MVGRFRSVRAMLVTGVPAAAAMVLLPLGFAFYVLDGRRYVGDAPLTAGLIAGAVAAGTLVGDLAWCLHTASRERAGAQEKPVGDGSR